MVGWLNVRMACGIFVMVSFAGAAMCADDANLPVVGRGREAILALADIFMLADISCGSE